MSLRFHMLSLNNWEVAISTKRTDCQRTCGQTRVAPVAWNPCVVVTNVRTSHQFVETMFLAVQIHGANVLSFLDEMCLTEMPPQHPKYD